MLLPFSFIFKVLSQSLQKKTLIYFWITANCYNFSLELRLHLGKDLRVRKGFVQLVKCKDTGVCLCYIYKVTMRKRSTVCKAIEL